jgi:hypothetical protein
VESPYLRSSQSGESSRPMKDILGVEGEQYNAWCELTTDG